MCRMTYVPYCALHVTPPLPCNKTGRKTQCLAVETSLDGCLSCETRALLVLLLRFGNVKKSLDSIRCLRSVLDKSERGRPSGILPCRMQAWYRHTSMAVIAFVPMSLGFLDDSMSHSATS